MATSASDVTHDEAGATPTRIARNLRWLGPLCIASVVLLIVLIGGPALRQHYVLEVLRASKTGYVTTRTGPNWIHEKLGSKPLEPFETIKVVTIDSTSLPLVLENPKLFRGVERAWVSDVSLEPSVVRRLCGGDIDQRILPRLISFNAPNDKFGDQHLLELVASTQLQRLGLYRTTVDSDGLALLKPLSDLQYLDLRQTAVDDAGIAHLAQHRSLTTLYLANTAITDQALITIGGISRLANLDLSETKLTDAGLKHLSGLKNLYYIQLRQCEITDIGASALLPLTGLTEVYMSRTKISDAGVVELAKLPNLKSLNVTRTQVTAAGEAEFHRIRSAAGLPASNLRR